jgi:hypothetical protein
MYIDVRVDCGTRSLCFTLGGKRILWPSSILTISKPPILLVPPAPGEIAGDVSIVEAAEEGLEGRFDSLHRVEDGTSGTRLLHVSIQQVPQWLVLELRLFLKNKRIGNGQETFTRNVSNNY